MNKLLNFSAVFLLLFLFDCSEEEDIPASQKIFESRKIVYSELSFSVKEKLATVKSVWNNTQSNQFELEANAFNPLDGLFLIQDQGIVQQHLPSGTEYYTFPLIRRQNQNEFLENFVLVQRENQILGEYLIQYDFEHNTKPRVIVLENGSYDLLSNQAANPSGDTGCYELQPNAEVYENWTAEDFGFFGVDSAGYTWVVVACPNGGGSGTFSDDTCDGCFGEEPVTGEPNNNNGNLGGGGDGSNIEHTPPILTTSPTTITGSGSQFGSVNITSIVETINTILNNSLSTEEQNLLLSNTKLTVTILNYLSETNFSNDAKELTNEIINSLVELDPIVDEGVFIADVEDNNGNTVNFNQMSLNIALDLYSNEYFTDPSEELFVSTITSNSCCNFPSIIPPHSHTLMNFHIAELKLQNPDWSNYRIFWVAVRKTLQTLLDFGGLVPVVGEVCDVANGVIYAINGEGINATLSIVSAIPVAGWVSTGAKFAYKGSLKFTVRAADNIIEFGRRSGLRKTLNLTDSNLHAHHLIPWARKEHDLIQKAANSNQGFHMNEALNGIARPSNLHLTGHNIYNTRVKQLLDNYNFDNPNLSNDDAYDFVSGLAEHIRDLITANPNLNSGQIANLISYP